MHVPAFGFEGYVTVPPPPGGFWRVSGWDMPLDPPEPAPPLGADLKADDGHRYDDPDGLFKTLYCATEAEGALGECLGDFVYSAATAQRIEAFLFSEPDADFDEDYQRALREEDIEAFRWRLVHAPADLGARLIAVDDWRTYLAAAPRIVPALARYGVKRFDRQTLLDERRYGTRTLAGIWRADATDSETFRTATRAEPERRPHAPGAGDDASETARRIQLARAALAASATTAISARGPSVS
jgi:hypothetical protein